MNTDNKKKDILDDRFLSIKQSVIKENKEAKRFTDIFLSNTYFGTDYRVLFDILHKIILNSFQFFNSSNKLPCIDIFNPIESKNGWNDKGSTMLYIVNKDMPCIVNSIKEELVKNNIEINMMTNLVESGISFICISIAKLMNKGAINNLKSNIEKVIHSVELYNEDKIEIKSTLKDLLDIIKNNSHYDKCFNCNYEFTENIDFINWLIAENFLFLGYHKLIKDKKKKALVLEKKYNLGITNNWSEDSKDNNKNMFFIPSDHDHQYINMCRSIILSSVFKKEFLKCLIIFELDSKGSVLNKHIFYGLFSELSMFHSITSIPLIRKKIANIAEKLYLPVNGYTNREVVDKLNAYSRYELISMPEATLLQRCKSILELSMLPKLKVCMYHDGDNFCICDIFIPHNSYSTAIESKVKSVLSSMTDFEILESVTIIGNSHVAKMHITLYIQDNLSHKSNFMDLELLEYELNYVTKSWIGKFQDRLSDCSDGKELFNSFRNAFSENYKNVFSIEQTFYDIVKINKILAGISCCSNIYVNTTNDTFVFNLKVYLVNKNFVLSDMIPIVENMGFDVIDHHSYDVSLNEGSKIYIHHFLINSTKIDQGKFVLIKGNFEESLEQLWNKKIYDDPLNGLISLANMDWQEVNVIRALCKYLKQIKIEYGQSFIMQSLLDNAELSSLLIQLFKARFDPKVTKRMKLCDSLIQKIDLLLNEIQEVSVDILFKKILNVITSILRTNFFCTKKITEDYISLKINSNAIMDIPKPIPFVEIFVFSKDFEAIHLRGDKVARGGLRWSDRNEDFRTEVLGLMKAQMPKNSVIVPNGSKGGFIINDNSKLKDRDFVVDCYKRFLKGILDITDNIIGTKQIIPKNVIHYDDFDPYLVVAADKGTATFSDFANEVSEEYNFWLGDAFASGGSNGYDHKIMGITAKGSWLSVKHHFANLGLDVDRDNFTVIGIGDMSGDVFGNGMLLSKKILLVAAFNHKHIFIDPNPDASSSFKERHRLFDQCLGWDHYNIKCLSKGGAIYSKTDKTVNLSPEIMMLLNIDKKSVRPDQLISMILKAKADLLWNGGIGTYVKSSKESNRDADDKSNDSVRINGKDLNVRVVGEGGNLGFTQKGRIESYNKSILLNTDFIDNSAGVACSDREVNIKIALNDCVQKGILSFEERNKLLYSMTDEVENLVLQDNILQNEILTTTMFQVSDKLAQHKNLIHMLEKENLLDRAVEFLPQDDEIERMINSDGTETLLSRPDLSVLLSYSKISLYKSIMSSDLIKDKFFESWLMNYFPKSMHDKFKNNILNHQLRNEIISTVLINHVINRAGSSFIMHVIDNSDSDIIQVIKAYVIVDTIFNIDHVHSIIDKLGVEIKPNIKDRFRKIVNQFSGRALFWLLSHPNILDDDICKVVSCLKNCIDKYLQIINSKKDSESLMQEYKRVLSELKNIKTPDILKDQLMNLKLLSPLLDTILMLIEHNISLDKMIDLHFEIRNKLCVYKIQQSVNISLIHDPWEKLSYRTIISNINKMHANITFNIMQYAKEENFDDIKNIVNKWLQSKRVIFAAYNMFIKNNLPDKYPAQRNISVHILLAIESSLTKFL